MRSKFTILFLVCTFLMGSAQAKKVYIKLYGDNAWEHVTQDEDNVVVELPQGNTTINSTLTTLLANDEAWIAKGVYQLTSRYDPLAGVKLYGGFKGDETDVNQRRVVDVDKNGMVEAWEFECATNLRGVTDSDNISWRFMNVGTAGVVIDGLTFSDHLGNAGTDGAAAIYASGNVVIKNSVFRNIKVEKSRDANAINAGAVQLNAGSATLLEGCLFEDCLLDNAGAATANSYGGAVNANANGTIRGCVFRNNQVKCANGNALGAAIFLNGGTVENCVIYNNESQFRGGGIYVHTSGSSKVINCVIANNKCVNGGGGLFLNGSNFSSYNSIFWNNRKGTTADDINMNNKTYTMDAFAYGASSNLGTNSISSPTVITLTSNPFVNPTTTVGLTTTIEKADFRLQATSPLLNKGVDNTSIPTTDFLGYARQGAVDLGAYEYFTATIAAADAPSLAANSLQNVSAVAMTDSWATAHLNQLQSALGLSTPLSISAEDVELTEGEDLLFSLPFHADAISYNRPLPQTGEGVDAILETICLPFAATIPAGTTLEAYHESNGTDRVFFTPVTDGVMAANVPYIMNRTSSAAFAASNAEFTPGAAITQDDKNAFVFKGSYSAITDADAMGKYISDGRAFAYSVDGASISPYRAYFEQSAGGLAPSFLYVNEDIPTNLPTSDGEAAFSVYSVAGGIVVNGAEGALVQVYTTVGQCACQAVLSLGEQFLPLSAGLYIVNGIKVSVK